MFEKIINLGLNLENISDVKDVPKEKQREFNDVVMECLENCKGKVKNGDQATVDSAIEQEIPNKDFQTYLKKILNRMMFGYRSLAPLREMQEKEVLTILNLINDIFENSILRNDILFADKFKAYGLESKKSMEDIIVTFKTLVKFYIISRYTQNSICMDFSEETGLGESISKIVAETIEKNYNQLQIVFLLEGIASK